MTAADLDPLGVQPVPQHPAAREREVQVQLVDAAHDGQIGIRNRPGQVADAAPTDTQNLRLPGNRQFVRAVDHRLALSRPALLSAPDKKSVLQRQLSDLGVQRFQIDRGHRRIGARLRPKYPSCPFLKLSLPLRDLVGMDVKFLRQIRPRPVALEGRQCHLRLECRGVVPPRSLCHRRSCSTAILLAVGQKLHSSPCPDFLGQLYFTRGT
jgi:uncharacterized protein YjiS (DUF1127 family)